MSLDLMHTNPRALFEAPEGYPGLIPRDVRTRRLHLRVEPATAPNRSWTIYEAADGWWVRRIVWLSSTKAELRGPGDTYAAEAQLHAATVTAALDALATIAHDAQRHPFPPRTFGIDGTSCYIGAAALLDGATVGWWCEPPEGWEPLAVWFEDTRALCEAALPRATDRDDLDPCRRGTHDTFLPR
jgi:hypothetical protein